MIKKWEIIVGIIILVIAKVVMGNSFWFALPSFLFIFGVERFLIHIVKKDILQIDDSKVTKKVKKTNSLKVEKNSGNSASGSNAYGKKLNFVKNQTAAKNQIDTIDNQKDSKDKMFEFEQMEDNIMNLLIVPSLADYRPKLIEQHVTIKTLSQMNKNGDLKVNDRARLKYYIDTSNKMFEVFLSVASQTESVLYINDTRSEIINAIPVINSYFKSLLESQYETQYYDISSDVDVLKKLANSICSEQSEIVNTDQA